MCSTVLTACRVGAIARPGKATLYVLLLQSYERRSYPHQPRWSVGIFGPLNSVMRHVFEHAALAEHGALWTDAGVSRPEDVLAMWMESFARPVPIRDIEIELRAGADFAAPIPSRDLGDALRALRASGCHELAAMLQWGTAKVRLCADADALLALYGSEGPLAGELWRVLPFEAVGRLAEERLAPPVVRGACPLPEVDAYRLGGGVVALSVDRGASWQAIVIEDAMAAFVERAYETELACSGAGIRSVATLRDLFNNAVQAPDGIAVTVETCRGVFGGRSPAEVGFSLGVVVQHDDIAGPFSLRVR